MDEKILNNEEINEDQRLQSQDVLEENSAPNADVNSIGDDSSEKSVGKTPERIFTSPEGGFLGFAITLCIGYVIHAFTRNSYKAKVKIPSGTEFSVSKEDEVDV